MLRVRLVWGGKIADSDWFSFLKQMKTVPKCFIFEPKKTVPKCFT